MGNSKKKIFSCSAEQLESPWLRQPWDTNHNWKIFSEFFLVSSQRNVNSAYRAWCISNNKPVKATAVGSVYYASRGINRETEPLQYRDRQGDVANIPTWQARAVAYDNSIARRILDDIASKRVMYAARAQAAVHNNTMTLLDKLTAAISEFTPSGDRIADLVRAHEKMAAVVGQLYQTDIPEGETGRVVTPEQQAKTTAERISRISDILSLAKSRAEASATDNPPVNN